MTKIEIAGLADICSFVTDGTHDSPRLQESGVPFIKGKHINSGRVDFDGCDYITREDHEKCIKRVKPQLDDILMANIGASIGDCARVTTNTEFSIKNVALLRPDPEKVDPSYFFHLVKSGTFQGRLMNIRLGSAQPYVSLTALRGFGVPVVSDIASQRRIGEIFTAYDNLIENNRRRIALLEQAARLLYREWFVHFRFPGHETAKFVDGLPRGWDHVTSSEAMQINPKTTWDKTQSKQIRLFPMAALSESGMSCDESKFEHRDKSTSVRFMNGDTLFARITPCLENGKTGFTNFLDEGEVACGSTEFIIFREGLVSRYFIYLMAREDGFRQNAITSMVGSSGRQRVQPSCFDKFNVSVPPVEIAKEFDGMVAPMFQQIQAAQKANQQLTRARDLLLPRLMDGRLPV
ncbi:restriction endonuclease subunit S [Falsihalocynthiibacter arcticus]|uniref:restriction endonuclease subunit S n=1 Tax=Falsihalocynthiibacter arcticus TaxID=1579316 RepID=UPI003001882A